MELKELREAAKAIAYSAIEAVNPEALIRRSVRLKNNRLIIGESSINLDEFRRILIVGAGKASASMTKALEDVLCGRICGGVIAVKALPPEPLKKITVLETGHPIPDERGVNAARRILSLVQQNARVDTLVLCVVSGGGSALLPLPREGIPLSDKQQTTKLLLDCGASVDEINTVRKHISRVKGGQLARAAAPARVFSLILSDVISDPLDIIASGPTVGDSSTFSDVKSLMEKYKIWRQVPESVRTVIENGLGGKMEETPKPDDQIFERVTNVIIGNNRSAIEAASARASDLGFHSLILTTCISGEAREVGIVLASIAIEAENSHHPVVPPACILAGGETTVTIKGTGKGGRNQELALSAALKLVKARAIVVASVGTDGTDGPTDAAGAIVDTTTVVRARQAGLDPMEYLSRNDSYNLLGPIGDLLITGPTGTNVMDLLIALVA